MTWVKLADDLNPRRAVREPLSPGTGLEVVTFADQHGPPLTDWQRDVVALAHDIDDPAAAAQRPHKRRRRTLGGGTVRWGRACALGGILGPLTGVLILVLS